MSGVSILWKPFLADLANTIVVLGMARGEYPKGLSFNDARTLGEVYALLKTPADVQAAEGFPQRYYGKHLILIGGGKANRLSYEFQECLRDRLSFWLEDGCILDRRQGTVLTPTYIEGKEKTIQHLTSDYGLITYATNPFLLREEGRKVLHLGGIKGYGTLAAAYALTDPSLAREIDSFLEERLPSQQVLEGALQVLVRIEMRSGESLARQVTLQSIDIPEQEIRWQAPTYRPRPPSMLCEIELENREKIRQITLDGKPLLLENSDAERLVLLLARRRKEADRQRLPGWMDIDELAVALWGAVEDKPEQARSLDARERDRVALRLQEVLQRRYHIPLSAREIREDILDPILGEVTVPEVIKRRNRLRTRVGLLNKEVQRLLSSPAFRLIESGHWGTRSYRFNIEPDLIIFRHPAP
ncbi:MAG: hypothetical protein D6736_12815 [Nitrospinota bacterium]|nr:MAG: hypothetical protein D6736_12815 [Nitrospinota bacterium]